MKLLTTRPIAMAVIIVLLAMAVHAQTGTTLSGTIAGPSGVISSAHVSARNAATGEAKEAITNTMGVYTFENLPAGDYDVSATATGLNSKQAKVSLKDGVPQKLDLSLTSVLTLNDLGLSTNQTQGSAADQARLDKRTHMLKMHQRWGLITTAPLVATVFLGPSAGGRSTSSTERNVHATLGAVTAGMYITTASYAIFAPKIPDTKTRGPIRLHKTLAWIHGTGMILTPILGAMAYSQKSNGQKVHGIASAHGPVAAVTAIAYGTAIASVSIKF